eukprot:4856044-Prymnesium_polylepis.1
MGERGERGVHAGGRARTVIVKLGSERRLPRGPAGARGGPVMHAAEEEAPRQRGGHAAAARRAQRLERRVAIEETDDAREGAVERDHDEFVTHVSVHASSV